jgi:hypothetical protein
MGVRSESATNLIPNAAEGGGPYVYNVQILPTFWVQRAQNGVQVVLNQTGYVTACACERTGGSRPRC